jgi:hypothetical protein
MTASTQRQARAELRWWRANRDAKHVFSQELRAARQVLAHGPKLEIYGYFEVFPYGACCSRRRVAMSTIW